MPHDSSPPNVRVVTNEAVVRELMEMAGVNVRWHLRPDQIPLIGPMSGPTSEGTDAGRLGRFFVVATMVLGAADALMLSIIARTESDGTITFPGWQIL